MAGFCQHNNEPPGSLEAVEFIDRLSDSQHFKKDLVVTKGKVVLVP